MISVWRSVPPSEPVEPRTLSVLKAIILGQRVSARERSELLKELTHRSQRLDPFTIVVGGVTLGGAGKSQAVSHMAEAILLIGAPSIYVLGHGYRSQSKRGVVRELRSVDRRACITYGDEAVMIHKRLSKLTTDHSAAVLVGGKWRERWEFARVSGASLIISDGGLYTSSLPRHLSVTIIPLPSRYSLLPFGDLTRPPHRWATGAQCWYWSIRHMSPLLEYDDRQWPIECPSFILHSEIKVQGFIDYRGTLLTVEEVRDRLNSSQVSVICAIAKPQRLIHTLQRLGLNVKQVIACRDHQVFSDRHLNLIEEDTSVWITTDKDDMKFNHKPPNLLTLSIHLKMLS